MGRRSRKRERGPSAVADPPSAEAEESGAPRTGAKPTRADAKASAARADAKPARGSTQRRPSHRRPPLEERPKAPWDPIPLVEICVLIGIVIALVGLIFVRGERGVIMLICGMALCSLAGLDTSVREHFAGYRSHSTLLAGMVGVLIGGVVYVGGALLFDTVLPIAVLAAALIAFGCAFTYFRSAFARRAGVSWRS